MKRIYIVASAVAAVGLVASGCFDGVMHRGNDMASELSAARAENDRHRDVSLAAASLTDIIADLDRHDDEMGSSMAGMQHALGEMGHCASGALDGMGGTIGQMGGEMTDHRAAMEQAVTVEDARRDANTHAARLNGMLVTLGGMFDGSGCM
jgi:hypothetical protein